MLKMTFQWYRPAVQWSILISIIICSCRSSWILRAITQFGRQQKRRDIVVQGKICLCLAHRLIVNLF